MRAATPASNSVEGGKKVSADTMAATRSDGKFRSLAQIVSENGAAQNTGGYDVLADGGQQEHVEEYVILKTQPVGIYVDD